MHDCNRRDLRRQSRTVRSSFRPWIERLEDRLSPSLLPPGFTQAQVATGLANPTAMEFAPDGRLFVAEQGGSLRVIKGDALLPAPFVRLNVDSSGERGLLGVTFDPAFPVNHFVYAYYTTATAPVHNRVSRFIADGDVAVPGSETVLLDLDNLGAAPFHNGGAIHFGVDGKLYVGVGENTVGANAQSLNNRLGKLLRINSDGSIPADNPFFNQASGANRSIWALGLRNPFTFAVQPGSGRIFINDVGSNRFEEINDGVAGANYGWPATEGPTTDPRFRSPLFAYEHDTACAISGGTFYNPASVRFPSSFVGDYFFADLCGGWIRRLDPATGIVTDFATALPNFPVDVKVDAGGRLYFLSRGDAAVYRIDGDSSIGAAAGIVATGADAGGGPSVSVFDVATGAVQLNFFAYDPRFTGGVRVAMGDTNLDGVTDVVTAPGPGGGPHIRVFDGRSGQLLRQFFAFDANFTGGCFVAVGDANGDGAGDIIVGADAGGGPNVTVFSGPNGARLAGFFPYDVNFTGGVRVAAADMNGDGMAEIITGAGPGGGPNVAAFSISGASLTLVSSFFAFDPGFTGGVYVSAGDVLGGGSAQIIAGAGSGGGPHVRIFNVLGDTRASFFAYDPGFGGGVRVAAVARGSASRGEVVTAAGSGGGPDIKIHDPSTLAVIDQFFAFHPLFTGGVFVAAVSR